ncbi:MAG: DMT family transporter [Rhodocyclaceae bacterium]|nr:DMT family transporter [Rhodocyclaceae bacterium]
MNAGFEPSPLRGILLLLTALGFFVALDATAKQLTATLPVAMLVWARYTVHCLLMVVLLAPSMGGRLLGSRRRSLQVLRAVSLLLVTGLTMSAFRIMPIAEATAILFLAPLLVTLASGPLLGERVGRIRWLAVAVGFVGVLMIARPGSELPPAGIALAASAALSFAAYQLLTRVLSPTEHPVTTLFYTALVGSLVSALSLPWLWPLPALDPVQALKIVSLGVYGGAGHFLLIRAFREAPASTLSPVMYAQLGFATLAGGLVFGQWPDAAALAGIAVIALAGVMTALQARRDHARSRPAAPSVSGSARMRS